MCGGAGFPTVGGGRRRGAGEAELGVGGKDEPGPAAGGGRVAASGPSPAEGLLEHAEGVLDVERSQERPPAPVDVGRGGPLTITPR